MTRSVVSILATYLNDDAHDALERDEEDPKTALLRRSSHTISKQFTVDFQHYILFSHDINTTLDSDAQRSITMQEHPQLVRQGLTSATRYLETHTFLSQEAATKSVRYPGDICSWWNSSLKFISSFWGTSCYLLRNYCSLSKNFLTLFWCRMSII